MWHNPTDLISWCCFVGSLPSEGRIQAKQQEHSRCSECNIFGSDAQVDSKTELCNKYI